MPQIQIVGPSRQDLMMEEVGKSLGQGLSQFTNNYMANRSLQKVLSDPSLKDAPLSEKQSRLQMALQPYGETGQQMLQTSMAISQQQQAEGMMAKVRKIASNPNATPSEILFGVMEAGAGIPGSEKYIAPVYQQLMLERQRDNFKKSFPTGKEQKAQKQTLPEFGIPSKNTVSPIEQPGLGPQAVQQPQIGEDKRGLTQVPAAQNLPFKNSYITPEQYSLARSNEIASGGDGSATDNHVTNINNAVKQGRQIAKEDLDWTMRNQELERERENSINEYISPKIKEEFGKLSPIEGVRAEQYAKQIDKEDVENGIINTPADLYEKTRNRMNNYLTYKGRLEGTPVRKNPATGETVYKDGLKERPTVLNINNPNDNAKLDAAAEIARPLVMMGEDDEVRRILASKKYYSDEGEDIINRALNPNSQKEIKSFRDSLPSAQGFAKETEGLRNVKPEIVQQRRQKEVADLEKSLIKSLNPSSSLILLWREAEHAGYDSEVFTEALRNIRRNGYDLSPRQIRDLPQVNKPTMTFMRKLFG